MIIDGNKLIPDEGKWLYNGEVCSDLVYLGKNASKDDWQEVDHYINTEPVEELDEEITLEDAVSEVDRLKALLEQNGISYEKGE